ncbi:uroporphyrinogen-III C-methyltransferase [Erwiniaceae bacterium BAC15a-03b]|uniref:uroporphyrinogen-III C-methyltransferase n=1 Tax=Winslowiella arboricola TaxID=2978220 RepID=A0A9J6PNT9_9GAMM|nr:uroporphyrinogen-III C-methyltransferase [Winslowiella arboricola]MCU5774879.1 uroporphyrinogen-III C-methyltransferase [Winslowiella arboricola]MCU5779969.1 uroporphyrinogen-III C-methyltransferase [Winslowiella arboricola]
MTVALSSLDKLLRGAMHGAEPGAVWLVGAGPGDVDLLTVKALRLIEQAQVLVYDRLVSAEILALAPADALCIDVGKTPGFHGMKQSQINQLLVDLARTGQQVIRLKGGDPFIFGRGGEEMSWAQQAGIPCHVVPGITAATGCAAACGIPLTHRAMAQSVRFITGHGRDGKPQPDWQSLQDPRQTLVFYMGLTWCEALSQQLIAHGRDAQTPVAIIERGTRRDQRVMITRLAELARCVAEQQPQSPSLLIIGDVVTLYRPAYSATSTLTPSASNALIDS